MRPHGAVCHQASPAAFRLSSRLRLPTGRAGSYAVNPANAEEIPIWVADYVLGGYGSGAIMVRRRC